MQKIIPNLWFDTNAEEAANFYVSVFKEGAILDVTHYPEAGQEVHGMPAGMIMTVSFELNGQEFLALNGGPAFQFNEAVSFIVNCENQKEVDYYWEKLSAVPESEMCGWLKDKYGVSWQIVPAGMDYMFNGPNKEKVNRAMEAMLKMKKLDILELQKAYEGE